MVDLYGKKFRLTDSSHHSVRGLELIDLNFYDLRAWKRKICFSGILLEEIHDDRGVRLIPINAWAIPNGCYNKIERDTDS